MMNLPPRGAGWVMLKIQLVDRYAKWYSESPKKRLCEGSNPSLSTICLSSSIGRAPHQ